MTVPPGTQAALAADLVARLHERLGTWYRTAARDLPWRRTRDPYAIWVSEAMLQQTRVETVLERWGRFLARFPTLEALAAADEEDVVAEWSGLGYYRRARGLVAAARIVRAAHSGEFPRDRRAAEALPGVGRYTAGAVLSIAHDLPEPLVDGNVERVFARLFAIDAAAGSSLLAKRAWALAAELVPERGAGDWNQALMELGATVCTPRAPRCLLCPLRADCRASALGDPERVPRPKARRETLDVRLVLARIARGDCLLLEQRPPAGRMAGMWQLPSIERPARTGLFPPEWPGANRIGLGARLGELSHSITHHRIRATVMAATITGRVAAPLAWVPEAELDALALTGMTRKALGLGAEPAVNRSQESA